MEAENKNIQQAESDVFRNEVSGDTNILEKFQNVLL